MTRVGGRARLDLRGFVPRAGGRLRLRLELPATADERFQDAASAFQFHFEATETAGR